MARHFSVAEYREKLTKFGGVLKKGDHAPPNGDANCCALEFDRWVRDPDPAKWSDDPGNLPDIRCLNDSCWWSSDQARTDAMLPVMAALSGWADWPKERRIGWARAVALRVIREMLPKALRLMGLDAAADACANVSDLGAAKHVALAARDALRKLVSQRLAERRSATAADAQAAAQAATAAYAAAATAAYAAADAAAAYAAAYAATAAQAATAAYAAAYASKKAGEHGLIEACRILAEEAEKSAPSAGGGA